MATMKNISKADDVEITLEDQQQINTFARRNTKMEELKDRIEIKKKDLQNLEDAGDELLMVDDSSISFKFGEIFIHMTQEETEEYLERAKTKIKNEISTFEVQLVEIEGILSGLKAKLYGKFGDNINLETEEE